ncbi:hypothetical protein [Botryobacter ruber]|uniref:hypothetical protein n=1 Tax=Botryobacter ruber TaxID=2171629 RepID=UPI000F650389|nr:hypothetical protein [Botryobacter ruber]
MIRLLLTAIVLLSCTANTIAQIQAGTKVVSGSIGYRNSSKESKGIPSNNVIALNKTTNKQQHLYLAPSFGYFITENLEVGVAFQFQNRTHITNNHFTYSREELSRPYRKKVQVYSFSSYIEKYFFMSEKFAFLAIASAGFNQYNDESKHSGFNFDENGSIQLLEQSVTSKNRIYSAALSPGITYFVSERINLRAILGGLRYIRDEHTNKYNFESSYKTNQLILSLSPQDFNVGMGYFFSR